MTGFSGGDEKAWQGREGDLEPAEHEDGFVEAEEGGREGGRRTSSVKKKRE